MDWSNQSTVHATTPQQAQDRQAQPAPDVFDQEDEGEQGHEGHHQAEDRKGDPPIDAPGEDVAYAPRREQAGVSPSNMASAGLLVNLRTFSGLMYRPQLRQ